MLIYQPFHQVKFLKLQDALTSLRITWVLKTGSLYGKKIIILEMFKIIYSRRSDGPNLYLDEFSTDHVSNFFVLYNYDYIIFRICAILPFV